MAGESLALWDTGVSLGVETARTSLAPVFDFDPVAVATLTARMIGELHGLSAGKAATIRIYQSPPYPTSGFGTLLATFILNANGLFSKDASFSTPSGVQRLWVTTETDSLTSAGLGELLYLLEIG